MRPTRRPTEDLRTAVDCLPVHTRQAMLEGIRRNDIVAGAYTDRGGGVCPMLAAHRTGGRASLHYFARVWDRFTGTQERSRRATEREVGVLTAHLEVSLLAEESCDLGEVVAEHRELLSRSRREAAQRKAGDPRPGDPRPGDPDRQGELRRRTGWAWLRPFRRLDDYQRALARVEADRDRLPAEHAHTASAPGREREPAAAGRG